MRFPVKVRHRKAEATIYGKSEAYPFYRLAYRAAGKRIVRSFATYAEAKQEADAKVRELASGSQSVALSAKEAADALTIRDVLATFWRDTGRKVSALEAVTQFVHAARLLGDRPLSTAVEGYLSTIATVKRVGVQEAVREFIASREPLTKATNGDRAQLSGKYAYNLEIQLNRFAAAFPSTAVCDLTKAHLDKFVEGLADMSPKTRNHYRASVRTLLEWALRKDYLPAAHRLGQADGLRPERAGGGEIHFYTPSEFRALLEHSDGFLRVMVAVGGLAGLRTQELLRLDWADLWRIPGYIEVSRAKAKTRQRRLVPIVPALAQWLEPFATMQPGPLWTRHEISFQRDLGSLCERAGVRRKANGLRHAYCTYAFALHGEITAAQQAGNSPAQLHQHYRGLATKAEAEQWFGILPAPAGNVIPLASNVATGPTR